MGRIAAVKMKIVSKLLLVFQNLIMHIPIGILNKIQNIMNKCIWNGKKPRLKNAILKLKPYQGGLEVPDITLYYHAATLISMIQSV